MRSFIFTSLFLLSSLPVCANEELTPAPVDSNLIHVDPITYQNESLIERAIVTDCNIPVVQFDALKAHATKAGVTLAASEAGVANNRVLQIQIANAIASGNAFIGHHKQLTLVGKLLENGVEVASFSASRTSGGGAFAGFKGSCAVLHRCADTLGKDISRWLKAPTKDARLGELK